MPDQPAFVRCPRCQCEVPLPDAPRSVRGWRRWRVALVLAGLFLLAVAVGAWRYRGQVQTVVQWLTEVTGSTSLSVAALGVSAVIGVCLVAWLLFPLWCVVAWFDLRRRLRDPGDPRRG